MQRMGQARKGEIETAIQVERERRRERRRREQRERCAGNGGRSWELLCLW